MHGDSLAMSLLEGVCIACGSFSIKGARRVVSLSKCETIASLWKEIFSEEIEREDRLGCYPEGNHLYVQKVLLLL